MALIIDSSVFLSSLDAKETHCFISRKFIQSVHKKRIEVILPIIVPLEIGHVFQRQKVPYPRIDALYRGFFENSQIQVVPLEGGLGSRLLRDFSVRNLKTSDWIIAGTAFLFGCDLITWDQKLLRSTRDLISAQTPEDWLKSV